MHLHEKGYIIHLKESFKLLTNSNDDFIITDANLDKKLNQIVILTQQQHVNEGKMRV